MIDECVIKIDVNRFIAGFATRVTRPVPLVEQELLILPEHLEIQQWAPVDDETFDEQISQKREYNRYTLVYIYLYNI